MAQRPIQRGPKTIEVFADTRGRATCRGPKCGRSITWAEVVKSGKKMCFTGDPVALTTRHDEATHRLIEALPFDDNHWASCPDRKRF